MARLKVETSTSRRKVKRSKVAMTNLDPRTNTDDRIKPLEK